MHERRASIGDTMPFADTAHNITRCRLAPHERQLCMDSLACHAAPTDFSIICRFECIQHFGSFHFYLLLARERFLCHIATALNLFECIKFVVIAVFHAASLSAVLLLGKNVFFFQIYCNRSKAIVVRPVDSRGRNCVCAAI